MSTTYNPKDPAYFDEADLRKEYTRVYDACHGCRLCWNLCPSFESLFDMIDENHDGDVEALTDAEQDRVVDECYQCKLCYIKCPYIPPHEWNLDFPRLMLRGTATKAKKQKLPSIVDQAMSRTDFIGFMSTTAAPIANLATGKPGSLPRKIMEKTMGIAANRILPTYSGERFSTWFKKRQKPLMTAPTRKPVVLFQTCIVEYQDPNIGKDVVKVLERNGIPVEIAEGSVCCGLPWLDAGNIDNFNAQAEKNAKLLAGYIRDGKQVVIPQPSCGYTVKKDYAQYIGSEDAILVGKNTFDIAEYLMNIHRKDGGLDTEFGGKVEEKIAWHVPCHLRAQQIGHVSKQLMELTGAKVTAIEKCSGIDGTWGLRAKNYEMAKKVAQPLKNQIEQAGCNCIAGDCHLANGAILEETGSVGLHPIQVLARAYGIPEEKS